MEHWYEREADNFGTIQGIIHVDDMTLVQCGGTIGTLDVSSCVGFQPCVGDEVELFISDDGWILKKA